MVPALEDVVLRGTAKQGAVPGYRVGGKTGTAQKVSPQGGYMSGKYVVSFVGFLPAEEPGTRRHGHARQCHHASGRKLRGKVAAPVFSSIAEKAMRYLNIEPTEPITPVPG